MRKPMDMTLLGGERIEITADIAVGVIHMARGGKNVDELLREVQRVTRAACAVRSRAAFSGPDACQSVAVKSADLASSWGEVRAQTAQAQHS